MRPVVCSTTRHMLEGWRTNCETPPCRLSEPCANGLKHRAFRSRRKFHRTTTIKTACALKARWCLDVRYGVKLDAVKLLQQWVRDIGSSAGLTSKNTCINSGSVGSPESRLELEVAFDTLAELEIFWASIPAEQHQQWSKEMQQLIVHGSPVWEIYRTVDAFPADGQETKVERPGVLETLVFASEQEITSLGMSPNQPEVPTTSKTTESGLSIVQSEEEADAILDWKGEPMKINPGDKLPFFK
jgi:hypothetical protein